MTSLARLTVSETVKQEATMDYYETMISKTISWAAVIGAAGYCMAVMLR